MAGNRTPRATIATGACRRSTRERAACCMTSASPARRFVKGALRSPRDGALALPVPTARCGLVQLELQPFARKLRRSVSVAPQLYRALKLPVERVVVVQWVVVEEEQVLHT